MTDLHITSESMRAIIATAVEQRVEEILTPERLFELAEDRIARLTLEEARVHLRCKNETQLLAFCREHKIPIRHYTQKKKYILLADIQKADREHARLVPDPSAPTGTKVVRIPEATKAA